MSQPKEESVGVSRAEVEGMIAEAVAPLLAKQWNLQCIWAGRDDLRVKVLDFASDDFKTAVSKAFGVPVVLGRTPKAPWSIPFLAAADLVSEETQVLGTGELLLERLDAILKQLDSLLQAVGPVGVHISSPSVGAPSGAECDNPNPTDGDLPPAAAQWSGAAPASQ